MNATKQGRDDGRVGLAHWMLLYGESPTNDDARGQAGIEEGAGEQQQLDSRTRDQALEARIERARVALLAAPTADLRRARCADMQHLIGERSAAQVAAMERAKGLARA